jgi:SAM-dependent methyltransferase
MPRIDNTKFYNLAIRKYGLSAKGVHWTSKYNQYVRFKTIRDFINNIDDQVIVDAGCGFGDFYIYLNKNVSLPQEYIGIDCEEKMVEIAKLRIKQKIIQKDIINDKLPIADYYVCSGAMNILTKDETFKFIENCFKYAKKGFIFNMLEIAENMNEDIYNYNHPKEIISFCEKLNKTNYLVSNYLKGDFTIFMKK